MNKNIESISESILKEVFKSWKIWLKRFNNSKFNFSIFDNCFYCVWFLDNEINSENNIDLCNGIENYYDFYLKNKKVELLVNKIHGLIFKQTTLEKKNLN